MTGGQQRASRELQRLLTASDSGFEMVHEPYLNNGWLKATVAINLGPIEIPFDRPSIAVSHLRFAGFPHVTWGKAICLYQSSIEWNPRDGLFGFFDRLKLWIERAAINAMDPVDGPLEPPHYNMDVTQKPFVIRANAPCAPGESWTGLALLQKHVNRTELIGWNDLSGQWPTDGEPAFAVILPKELPMEFPANGAELFREIEKAGMERDRIIRNLALASLLSVEGEPIHLVLGLPMRRAADGSQRLHLAVWTTDAERARTLRAVLPQDIDTDEISNLRSELSEAVMAVFELTTIKWCQILEDRDEIVVRRDVGTSFAWCTGKAILIIGCGALGSWVAEMVARTKARTIHLIDNAIVKPGILARQNFELKDIGSNKAEALAKRLVAIAGDCIVVAHNCEAHAFVLRSPNGLKEYDLVFDCTASSIFQMRMERDWKQFPQPNPPFISLIIDSRSKHCLCVLIQGNSTGGLWDAYLSLKILLCAEGKHGSIVEAFYSERAADQMFQPEPGCSDPTFVGSTADVVCLLAGAVNVAISSIADGKNSVGIGLSAAMAFENTGPLFCVELPQFLETQAGRYRVRIAKSTFAQARSHVEENNRRRPAKNETGGLLWGFWDDAVQVIWVFGLSGPPPDSKHSPALFICGIKGTREEHQQRLLNSHGANGFIGHWHTHPSLPSKQSDKDIATMTTLVSSMGQNHKRSTMLIFGRAGGLASAGIYVYESESRHESSELISVGESQITLEFPVV